MTQKRSWIGCLVMFIGIWGCSPDGVRLQGKMGEWSGSLEVWGELPGQDTVLLGKDVVKNGEIDLTLQVNPPARLRLCFEKKDCITFIVDRREGTWIQGNIDSLKRCTVEGAEMEARYQIIRKLFREKYEEPLRELEETIGRLKQKTERSGSEEKKLKESLQKKERYQFYRIGYSKKMIEVNPANELSLFLLQEELKDSVDLQRELFLKMDIKNKESNIYQVLAAKLK